MAIVACGSPTSHTPVDDGSLTLTAVSGAIPDDTIDATLATPLTIEVRGAGGQLKPGVSLHFVSVAGQRVQQAFAPIFSLSPTLPGGLLTLDAVTDAQGRIVLQGTRGFFGGTGTIEVRANSSKANVLELPWRILAGQAANFDGQPVDTAIRVGGGYLLRTVVKDRGGNPVSSPTLYSTDIPAVSVAPDGTVSGLSLGQATITMRNGSAELTRWVSVVPVLTIACIDDNGLQVMEADGRNHHQLLGIASFLGATGLDWRADGNQFMLSTGTGFDAPGIRLGDPITKQLTALNSHGLPNRGRPWPRYDLAGQWIYFGQEQSDLGGVEIWRERADGSAVEQLTQLIDSYTTDVHPSPSPDGTRVAFATDRRDPHSSTYELAMYDLASRSFTISSTTGYLPRWSPDGTRIAYLGYDGNVYLADAATLTGHQLNLGPASPNGPPEFLGGLDWSVDGAWLLSRGALVDTQTGTVLPLVLPTECSQGVFVK